MRLGDLLRKGCEGTTQAFKNYGNNTSLCALGAIFKGAGGIFETDQRGKINSIGGVDAVYFRMSLTAAKCPACAFDAAVNTIIPHLNDNHRWSREAIAEWLDVMEPNEEGARVIEREVEEKNLQPITEEIYAF